MRLVPQRLSRAVADLGIRIIERMYAAARPHQALAPVMDWGGDANTHIGESYREVRARVRQQIRDNPFFQAAVEAIVGFRVGEEGFRLVSRVRDDNEDKPDRRTCQIIEDDWSRFCERADAAERYHVADMAMLQERTMVESGDFLAQIILSGDNRSWPLRILVHESDRMTKTEMEGPTSGTWEGVVYDSDTSRLLGVWLDGDGYRKQDTFLPADQVMYNHDSNRPYQLRGISPFAPALILAGMGAQYTDTELTAQSLASQYLAFIKCDNPETERKKRAEMMRDGRFRDYMKGVVVEYLPRTAEISFPSQARQSAGVSPFLQIVLRAVSRVSVTPYELISGDYGQMNYSTAKVSRNDILKVLRPIYGRRRRTFYQRLFRLNLATGVACGRLSLRNFWQNPDHYSRSLWVPPGIDSPDPLRDAKAASELIDNLLMSPYEYISGRGRDPREVAREIAEYQDDTKDLGLEKKKTTSSVKTNPAAIGAKEEGK